MGVVFGRLPIQKTMGTLSQNVTLVKMERKQTLARKIKTSAYSSFIQNERKGCYLL